MTNTVAYGFCVDGVGGGFGDYEVANLGRVVAASHAICGGGKGDCEVGGIDPKPYFTIFRCDFNGVSASVYLRYD